MTRHEAAARYRSRLYCLMADMLSYPSEALLQSCENGQLQKNLDQCLAELPYPLQVSPFNTLVSTKQAAEIQSEYLRLFELPIDGSPCPLYGGALVGNRQQVMEALLRLYRHFGISTQGSACNDLPDSLCTVLEFLCFLASKEAQASDGLSARRAQRDLLQRYLRSWVTEVQSRLAARHPAPFYQNTVQLLDDFTRNETACFT